MAFRPPVARGVALSGGRFADPHDREPVVSFIHSNLKILSPFIIFRSRLTSFPVLGEQK